MKRYIIWLVIFAALEIGLALYLTVWREHFWNAVAQKQSVTFLHQLLVFTGAALGACFVSGFSGYLVSLTAIKWREKLNDKAFPIRELEIENISQRIQEDCMTYPDLVINLAFGIAKAIMYILVFSISLILSYHFWYLGVFIAYTLIGMVVTRYIAKPLTKKQKQLTYFQQFYSQIGVVVPLIIIAPFYFTTPMTLGMLMRFNSLSSTILENLSYGITSFATINRLISCRKRLKEAKIL